MVALCLEVSGLLQFITYSFLHLLITVLPEWKINDTEMEITQFNRNSIGLWQTCTTQSTGDSTCNSFSSFWLGADNVELSCRVLMIVTIALNSVCFALLQPVFSWVTCIESNKIKSKLIRLFIACMILSFITSTAALLIYSNDVLKNYHVSISLRGPKTEKVNFLF